MSELKKLIALKQIIMRIQIALINTTLEKTVFAEECNDLQEVEKCIR